MLFASVDDLHASLGRLLQDVAADPALDGRLRQLDANVELRLRQPDTTIAIAVRDRERPEVGVGVEPGSLAAPDVVLTLDADVAHRMWLGTENVSIAVARGQIQARGDVERIAALFGLAGDLAPRYAEQLAQGGRADLVDAPVPAPPAPGERTTDGGADAEVDPVAAASDGTDAPDDTDAAAEPGAVPDAPQTDVDDVVATANDAATEAPQEG